MTSPAFNQLVNLYQRALNGLFRGNLLEFLAHPEITHTPEVQRRIWDIALRMAKRSAVENAKSWRSAAAKSSRGREIFEALRAEIQYAGLTPEIERMARQNARLITSLPWEIAQHISQFAGKQHLAGARPGVIEKELRKLAPRLAANKIRLIARTQMGTAESELTQLRSERLGIPAYQWQSSRDQRVRKSHRNMDGVIVFWNDPPSPEALVKEPDYSHYHCGATFNCRCVSLPLVDLDEVKWPARVYRSGSITRMTRAQFTRLVPLPLAA